MAHLCIKEIGKLKGFNMSSLSRAAKVSFTTVKRLWQHPESPANTDTLEQIAKALGVSIRELFDAETKENEQDNEQKGNESNMVE